MRSIRCTADSSSAARLFVQLCNKSTTTRLSSRGGGSPSLLDDVLLPPSTRAFHMGRSVAVAAAPKSRNPTFIQSNNSSSRRNNPSRPNATSTNIIATTSPFSPRRTFSATPTRNNTQAIHNPQNDEDGKEMILEITPRAANRLNQIMTKDSNPSLALRVQVESGGCHGYQYLMSLITLPPLSTSSPSSSPPPSSPEAQSTIGPSTPSPTPTESSSFSPTSSSSTSNSEPVPLGEEDTVFAFLPDGSESATATEGEGEGKMLPKIVLDGPSLELLKGSKLDFTMELIGSQFKIIDNPYASSSCGCGTSFDIKF